MVHYVGAKTCKNFLHPTPYPIINAIKGTMQRKPYSYVEKVKDMSIYYLSIVHFCQQNHIIYSAGMVSKPIG